MGSPRRHEDEGAGQRQHSPHRKRHRTWQAERRRVGQVRRQKGVVQGQESRRGQEQEERVPGAAGRSDDELHDQGKRDERGGDSLPEALVGRPPVGLVPERDAPRRHVVRSPARRRSDLDPFPGSLPHPGREVAQPRERLGQVRAHQRGDDRDAPVRDRRGEVQVGEEGASAEVPGPAVEDLVGKPAVVASRPGLEAPVAAEDRDGRRAGGRQQGAEGVVQRIPGRRRGSRPRGPLRRRVASCRQRVQLGSHGLVHLRLPMELVGGPVGGEAALPRDRDEPGGRGAGQHDAGRQPAQLHARSGGPQDAGRGPGQRPRRGRPHPQKDAHPARGQKEFRRRRASGAASGRRGVVSALTHYHST